MTVSWLKIYALLARLSIGTHFFTGNHEDCLTTLDMVNEKCSVENVCKHNADLQDTPQAGEGIQTKNHEHDEKHLQ